MFELSDYKAKVYEDAEESDSFIETQNSKRLDFTAAQYDFHVFPSQMKTAKFLCNLFTITLNTGEDSAANVGFYIRLE